MSLEGTNVTDRKNFTNTALAEATSAAIIKTTITNSQQLTAFSIINANCVPGSKCEECLNTADIDLTDTDAVKDAAGKDGVCGPVCSCTISDATLKNNVIVDFELSNCGTNNGTDDTCGLLTDDVKEQVIDSVTSALKEEYGDDALSGDYKGNITSMYETVVSYMGNVDESVSTLQILNLSNSTGANISDITMDIALNAILKAQYDTSYSESLNDLMDAQTSTISDYVDNTVTDDLSYAWNKTKLYFYIIIGAIVFLLVMIIIIYAVRALKK